MWCPSVCLSRSWIVSKWINVSIFEIFQRSGSNTILVFPHQTGWRYSDGNHPTGSVKCRCGIGTNRDSGLIAGYRRLLDVRSAKNFTDDEDEYMTQLATHHWLSIDCWMCELRSDKNSYRRPCSVDRDSPANICLWRPAAWTNTPKRTEKNLIVRSGISEAETTNDKRLRLTFCSETIQTRSIARPLCDSGASCYKYVRCIEVIFSK